MKSNTSKLSNQIGGRAMSDDDILNKGGDEYDIQSFAEQNGATADWYDGVMTDTNQANEILPEQTRKSLSSVLYSKGKQDEMYTPRYGVLPILEFLPKNAKVWCPFDMPDSQFVKVLKENGISVISSHIDNGQDFYIYEPEEWDIIVSNPPFTRKRQIFERALSFGKPFALLMTNTWLNDAAPKQLFYDIDLQLLMFDKRIEYSGEKKVTFSSSYYCRDLLPKQIIMRKLLR